LDYITISMEKIISLQLPAGSELAPLSQNDPAVATNIGKIEHTSFTPHTETNQNYDPAAAWTACGVLALAAVGLSLIRTKDRGNHHSENQ
jgi:hypothetical protein